MRFVDTRDPKDTVSFSEAVLRTFAPSGGLYQPATDVDVRQFLLYMDESTSFRDLAEIMISSLFEDEINPVAAARIARNAFGFSPEFRTVDGNVSLLELFHGPTGGYKDFGVSFLAAVLEEILPRRDTTATVLTASTGDTGCAVANAFSGKKGTRAVILVPSGCVSCVTGTAATGGAPRRTGAARRGDTARRSDRLMRLAGYGGNILTLEVDGTIDDCHALIRSAFADADVHRRFSLVSADSVNPGRLIPQTFYYVYAFTRLKKTIHGDFFFSVPSGNLGNLTAGIYAWKWGMPVNGFVAATNANDEMPRYLAEGVFTPHAPVHTVSDSLDVGNPTNLERLQAVFGGSPAIMRSMIAGESVTDEETLAAIRTVHEQSGILLDPHTAVGYSGARKFLDGPLDGQGQIIVLSTADPSGCPETVEKATGIRPVPPATIAALPRSDRAFPRIVPELGALVHAIESFDKQA